MWSDQRPAPRLEQIFQSYDSPLFFVTACTLHRRKIEALDIAHDAFRNYALRGLNEFNIAVGRYVMMPDHFHLFVRGGPDFELPKWMNGLKRAVSVALKPQTNSPIWQPGFFDHVLRSNESYSEKWEYVRNNPVRHGLVRVSDDWPYQGEIARIDRA
jgi:REP element-mobilizing transposase RayT